MESVRQLKTGSEKILAESKKEAETLRILDEFDREINSFFQVCPKEMLDKLENPISSKKSIDIAS